MKNADMPAMPAGSVRKKRPAHDPGGNWVETDRVQPAHAGLTKREYFAALAMQGLLAAEAGEAVFSSDAALVSCAVRHADALLARLEDSDD